MILLLHSKILSVWLLRHLPVIAVMAVIATTTTSGCGGPLSTHPAIGRTVGTLPLVSIADASRQPPSFSGKVTVLNFWGTWCAPCRRELPGLARIAGRLANQPVFQLVAISCGPGGADPIEEIAATTQAFLSREKISVDAWADPDGLVRMIFADGYGFGAYPTTYLVGTDARVVAVWTGYRSSDEPDMARAIVEAMKQTQ